MKCKNVMLFNFWAPFPKMYIFDDATISLRSSYQVNSIFSAVVQIYLIHVFDEVFYPRCSHSFHD